MKLALKIITSLVIVTTIVTNADCQKVYYGLKASYHQSFVKKNKQLYDNENDYVIYNVKVDKHNVYPSVGGLMQVVFKNAFFQFEGFYNARRIKYDLKNYLPEEIRDQSLFKYSHTLRFPIISGVETEYFKAGVGPVISVLLHQGEALNELTNFEEKSDTVLPAAIFMVGAKYENLFLELSYEFQFTGIDEHIFYKAQRQGFRENPHIVSLSTVFMF